MSFLIIMKKHVWEDEAKPTGDVYYYKNLEQKKARIKMFNDRRTKEERSRNEGHRFSAIIGDSTCKEYIIADRIIAKNQVSALENKYHSSWIQAVISKDTPTNHIYEMISNSPKFELSANEYISASIHASVWTSYVAGRKEIDGVVYEAKTSYDSKARRV